MDNDNYDYNHGQRAPPKLYTPPRDRLPPPRESTRFSIDDVSQLANTRPPCQIPVDYELEAIIAKRRRLEVKYKFRDNIEFFYYSYTRLRLNFRLFTPMSNVC